MAGVLSELTPYVKALVERGYRVAVADQYETEDGHARGDYPRRHAWDAPRNRRRRRAVPRGDRPRGRRRGRPLRARARRRDHGPVPRHRSRRRGRPPRGAVPLRPRRGAPGTARPQRRPTARSGPRGPLGVGFRLRRGGGVRAGRAKHAVREQFGRETADSVGIDSELALRAAGAVLGYVEETGAGVLASITRLTAYGDGDHVAVDATTQRNLELTETMRGDADGSLFETVDHTVTAPPAAASSESGSPARAGTARN